MSVEHSDTQVRILRALAAANERLEAEERRRTEPIAVIGMACRFPGDANSPEAYWQLLRDGIDAVSEFPADRHELNEAFDPDPEVPGRTYARHGGFIKGVEWFDAEFFGVSPREAEVLDPQQRLLLETAWEALERSGLTRERLRGSQTGVFVGITTSDFGRRLARTTEQIDLYYVTGNTLNMSAGRLSYTLGLRGPSLAVDTACSSSLVAVHLACQSLRARDCKLALAAGVNITLTADGFVALSKAGVLSPRGRCRTFDASADGMARAEGCGALMLKRLSDAQADGDEILALVRGSAVNQDGASGGQTVPNGPAQEDVIRQALANAGVEPSQVDCIEAHGTGTAVGDPIELRALGEVFGHDRPPDRPLLVGAVKANIGHAESAAGVAGIIKAVLCLQHRLIPAQVHFATPSTHVDWDRLPVVVPRRLTPFGAPNKARVFGVSGFGLSGTNAHVVLEEAPPRAASQTGESRDPGSDLLRRASLLVLSAADSEAVADLARRYADLLERDRSLRLDDICFSAATTRDHHAERLAVVASSRESMIDALAALQREPLTATGVRGRARSGLAAEVAFVFSGQGSQHTGMGRSLYQCEPVFRRVADECAKIAGRDLLFGDADAADDTTNAQPALFALEYGLASLLRSWGIEPAAVVGHSVGEYVAACLAGVFSLEEGLRLVIERGRLMGSLPRDGAMVAVSGPPEAVFAAARARPHHLAVAAVNGPDSTVLSGDTSALREAVAHLTALGMTCRPLVVSHAFHSPLMAPMLDAFRSAAARVTFRPPAIPFVGTLSGERTDAEAASPDYWVRHVMEPVLFARAISTLRQSGVRNFLEVGPHPTLTGLGPNGSADGDVRWVSTLSRTGEDEHRMLLALAHLHVHGVSIDWQAFYATRDRRRIGLPTYPFQRKRYWFYDVLPDQTRSGSGLFEIGWVEHGPAKSDRSTDRGDRPPARWLVVADESGVATDLTRRVRQRGDEVRIVAPACGPELKRALDGISSSAGNRPMHVVHLSGLGVPEGRQDADWDRAQELTVLSALQLFQAVAEQAAPGHGNTRVWFVTRGAQALGAQPVAVLQSPLWGLGRVAALEHPDIWGGLIDLDPSDGADAASLLEAIDGLDDEQLAVRNGLWFVPRLRPLAHVPVSRSRFPSDASYLITGGGGGLASVVAEWMIGHGARRVVLVGRREPGVDVLRRLDALRNTGAVIQFVRADLGNAEDARRAVAESTSAGRLRGIIHAAGALDDAALLRQDAARMATAMAGKARGAFNLDRLTRGLELDFVVFFSSLASVLGSPGQGNYAAANALLDALAAERRRNGQPALSINWGPWSDVGMTSRLRDAERSAMRTRGLAPLPVKRGLQLLERLLGGAPPQVAAAILDAGAVRRSVSSRRWSILDELSPPTVVEEPDVPIAATIRDRQDVLAYVGERIRAVLRLDGQIVDARVSLQEHGLDSIMATEARNQIQRDLHVDLPIGRFLGGASIEDLADALYGELALTRLATIAGEPSSDTEDLVL
jgi:acyl transferase domain-containing protein